LAKRVSSEREKGGGRPSAEGKANFDRIVLRGGGENVYPLQGGGGKSPLGKETSWNLLQVRRERVILSLAEEKRRGLFPRRHYFLVEGLRQKEPSNRGREGGGGPSLKERRKNKGKERSLSLCRKGKP